MPMSAHRSTQPFVYRGNRCVKQLHEMRSTIGEMYREQEFDR
jgi:hypothetical protein